MRVFLYSKYKLSWFIILLSLSLLSFISPLSSQNIVINEINYNSLTAFDAGNWTELYNADNITVNMSGWSLNDNNNTYLFPQGTILLPSSYLVVVEDTMLFTDVHTNTNNYIGPTIFGLSNGGEKIVLKNTLGIVIDSILYDDVAPWPTAPDGNGPTLSLPDPLLDNSLGSNWGASSNIGGTPGYTNGNPCLQTNFNIVINEINYNSSLASNSGDWVELYNAEPNAIDLSGWLLRGSNNTYTIPQGTTLLSGQYVVLVNNLALFTNIYPTINNYVGPINFGFSGAGELITLFNTDTCLVDEVDYDDAVPWPPAADGNGRTLSLISPSSDNSLPISWEASSNIGGTPGGINTNLCNQPNPNIVINEINYTALDSITPDWIELYNASASSVNLSGWSLNDETAGFEFPSNFTLDAGEYIVVTEDSALFQLAFPFVQNYLAPSGYGLSGTGELIALYNELGCPVDEVLYDNNFPWPDTADGRGPTLILVKPTLDNSLYTSWVGSSQYGGTPGVNNNDACNDFFPPFYYGTCERDRNEVGNTLASAIPFPFAGNYMEGKICPLGDEDYYSINIPSGVSQLAVHLYDLAKDYDLRLYTDFGFQIRTSFSDCLTDEIVTVANPPEGLYYIGVVGKNNNYYDGLNNYRLTYTTSKIGIGTQSGKSLAFYRSAVPSFKLYPNPVQNQLKITLNNSGQQLIDLSITNINGVIIKKEKLFHSSDQLTIDTHDLKSGSYILQIQTNEIVVKEKFIVIK